MTSTATITSRVLVGLEQLMNSKGLESKDLAARAGIDFTVAADPQGIVRLESFARLLQLAAEYSGDDAFGLKFGTRYPAGAIGIYHYVIVSSATVRDALERSARFVRLATSGYTITIEESAGVGCYRWNYSLPLELLPQYSDAVVGLLVDRMRYMTEPTWKPIGVEFAHAEPKSLRDFTEVLGHNLKFDQSSSCVLIDTATLDKPSRLHDPYLTKELVYVAEIFLGLNANRSGIVERTADQIIRALPNGEASETLVAEALGRSVRDLQRELAAAGTTFTGLREEVRIETAKRLLEQTDLQLTEIAFLLGFSELSVFSRMAKLWLGVSPSKYRRQSRGDAAQR
jgi:AraC-like DNA-binding protein